MIAYISHKAISMVLNPKVDTYQDLVTTSPNTRSDQAKSEREPLAPLHEEQEPGGRIYNSRQSQLAHGQPWRRLPQESQFFQNEGGRTSGRDKIKEI